MIIPFEEIAARWNECGGPILTDSEFFVLHAQSVADFAKSLDQGGVELAKLYLTGKLTFDFCDQIVNDLWGVLIARHVSVGQDVWPKRFEAVYDAFDAGEYHRRDDKSDNPVEDSTNPMIAKIIAEL